MSNIKRKCQCGTDVVVPIGSLSTSFACFGAFAGIQWGIACALRTANATVVVEQKHSVNAMEAA